jgi:hypothetical protein
MHANSRWLRPLVPALVAGVVLVCAGNAAAATCSYSASGNWTTGGSCGSTPASTDTVVIDSGVNVTVDANHSIAGITMNGGTITFAGSNPTLTDTGNFSSTTNDTLTGPGTLTVAGTETHSAGQLTVQDAANLILNSTGGIGGGNVCLIGNAAGTADDPSLQINGTFTVGSGADAIPISCNSGDDSAVLQVGATGTLVDAHSGATAIGAPMKVAQGGLVHVTAGTLQVVGGSRGATDDGHWSVDAGTTLLFNDSAGGTTFGAHTTIDGAGALEADGALTFPAGATFTIPDVTIGGTLTLDDNATTYTPNSITLAGGTLAGDRDVTPGTLVDTSNGSLDGNFTTTIASSATLTISAQLGITNGADFILNKDFTLGAGANICLTGDGTASGNPTFQINSTLTIGSAASASPFSCNSGVIAPGIKVNPTGTFVDARAGTTSIGPPMSNAGTVHIASGQVLAMSRNYDQIGGTTTIDSGGSFLGDSNTAKNVSGGTMTVNGTVGPTVTTTGGVLNGTGTVDGDLNNNGGSVEPASSPGILTVSGNYTQGSGGTLQVDIDGATPGTQYDQLSVGGNATLDGTLAIVTGGGFDPALTDTFDVLTATGSVSGTFASLTGAQLSGKAYSANYTAGPPGKVTLALSQTAPVSQTPPSIPSTAHPGDAITCNPGTWTGSPSFAFQWLRDGAQVATGSSYVVAPGDVGHTLVCRVTATNGAGSTNADSNSLVPTAVAAPTGSGGPAPVAAPANTVPPSVPPSAAVDDVIRCDPGTWTGSPTFAFQWLRDGAPAAGATDQFFAVGPGDVGHVLSCRVTATNAGGSASATSNTVTPQAPPVTVAGLPVAQGCVPGGLSLGIGVRSAGLRNVVAFLDGKRVFTSKKAHFRLVIPKGKISAGRHKLRILATYGTGKLNKNFSFVTCRGGGRSPAIKIGGAPSRTVCRATPFTFHAVVVGALPKSIRVTLDGKPLAKPGKLDFRLSIDVPPLAAGRHEVLVTAADRFGNASRSAIDFLRC